MTTDTPKSRGAGCMPIIAGALALLLLGAADCDDAKAPKVDIPTSPVPNGDPKPGGSCKGGPEHTTTIDGKPYECYDRKWRPKS
jgi:hypothetical protein